MRDFVLPFLDSIGEINHSDSKTVSSTEKKFLIREEERGERKMGAKKTK